MLARLRPYAILTAIWGLYFHPLLLNPGGVLYADYSDFLAEHLPARVYLTREWRETGELPLWNPYHFCGSPFVHDIQVGCFYPPYAVTYLVPESAVGATMSWVIALHVLAAGVFAYVYARSNALVEAGCLIAAIGFMLSAKWMTHLLLAGHTVTIGLAWLPLVVLGLERAVRRGSVTAVVGAGVAFAMIVLGTHPQWTFYAGIFAGLWTLAPALERAGYLGGSGTSPLVRELGRWVFCGLGVVAVAVALCAVQLLPTGEASGQSARTVGLESTQSWKVGLFTFFGMVGPSASNHPPHAWEARALLGLYWLAAAGAAPVLVRGRTRFFAGVLLGLLVFSLGGAALIDWLPGFRLFRIPSRMLLVATLPLAYLAGTTTDALVRRGWTPADRRVVGRWILGVVLFAVIPSLTCLTVTTLSPQGRPIWAPFVVYWAVVAGTIPVAVWLCLPSSQGNPVARTTCWVGVLVAELVAPIITLPEVRPYSAIYPRSKIVRFLAARMKPGESRVMDWDMGGGEADKLAILGVGAPEALIDRLETSRGYNPLDVRYYREFLNFTIGRDTAVFALSDIAQPMIPNFEIANRSLFDLLNVRYFVCAAECSVDSRSWQGLVFEEEPPLVPAIPPDPPPHLPRQIVYENRNPAAARRTWVVPEAAQMPAGGELAALTGCDFGRTVLLTSEGSLPPNVTGPMPVARISDYRPNRVQIELSGGGGGFLVLSDVWFPGWVCRIDGVEVPVYRANHAFRAVAVPAGATEAVFTFEPRSYWVGWWISFASLIVLVGFVIGSIVRVGIRNRRI